MVQAAKKIVVEGFIWRMPDSTAKRVLCNRKAFDRSIVDTMCVGTVEINQLADALLHMTSLARHVHPAIFEDLALNLSPEELSTH
eukprot:3655976-Amphidinium_carterae.1